MATLEPTPLTEPLDAYLWEVVQTLQAAVDRGFRHARERPDLTQASLRDCEEILNEIMRGDAQAWLGEPS